MSLKDTVDGINEAAWDRAMRKPIDYFALVTDVARKEAAKVLAQTEDNRDLCVVCQAHEKGVEDDTCSSMTCRETYWSEFWERM